MSQGLLFGHEWMGLSHLHLLFCCSVVSKKCSYTIGSGCLLRSTEMCSPSSQWRTSGFVLLSTCMAWQTRLTRTLIRFSMCWQFCHLKKKKKKDLNIHSSKRKVPEDNAHVSRLPLNQCAGVYSLQQRGRSWGLSHSPFQYPLSVKVMSQGASFIFQWNTVNLFVELLVLPDEEPPRGGGAVTWHLYTVQPVSETSGRSVHPKHTHEQGHHRVWMNSRNGRDMWGLCCDSRRLALCCSVAVTCNRLVK